MNFRILSRALASAAILAAILPAASAADPATLLITSKDWSAYTSGSGDSKICYVLSKPTSMEPKKAKRDAAYFIITDWPGRKPKTKSEPEACRAIYTRKPAPSPRRSVATSSRCSPRTKTAPVRPGFAQRADEVRLVEAMKRGQQLVVIGTSQRGTVTHDTYSLAGLSRCAGCKIHESCGM